MSTRARSTSRSQRRSEFDFPNRPVHEIFDSGRSLHAAELAAPNMDSGPILDYGFGTGEFAAKLRALTAAPIHACDMSFDLMGAAARNSASINYFLVDDPERPHLPFPHGFFHTIFLLDVLEHVGEQALPRLLAELTRVLHPDGQVIITVPHKGLFAWADPENMKFRYPRLHRRTYVRLHDIERYERRYGGTGGFGNYSGGARWHRHFTEREIESLLRPYGLSVRAHCYFSLLAPLLITVIWFTERIALRTTGVGLGLARYLWNAYAADSRLQTGKWAYDICVRAEFVPSISLRS
jgi:SAM-dependent methyltransferase